MEVMILHAGESVTLPGDIRITITSTDDAGQRARLGVDVPAAVAVLRGELVRLSPPDAPRR